MNAPFRTTPGPPVRSRLAGAVSAAFAGVALALAAPAAAGLTLELTDGSTLTVDRLLAADDSSLRIAAVRETGLAARSLPWDRVASATLDGERYSANELRLALGLAVDERLARHAGVPFAGPPPCPPPFPIPDLPFPVGPPGRVIGVRPDPLSAYADLAPATYPAGIPTTEAPFARAVLRERRRLEAVAPFGPPSLSPPPPGSIPLPTPSVPTFPVPTFPVLPSPPAGVGPPFGP